MILAEPAAAPVTCGCVVGVVAPAGIVTVVGEMVTLLLLLAKVTVTPPVGAATESVTGNATDWPRATLVLASVIAPSSSFSASPNRMRTPQ